MVEPNRVTVGAHDYSIGRMSVFDQAEIARRLSTVLVGLAMMKQANETEPLGPDAFATAMLTLSRPIPQPDWDWVLAKCLSVVSRREGDTGWQPVRNRNSGDLQYADIGMTEMLELVWRVTEAHELPDFFSRPLASSPGKTQG